MIASTTPIRFALMQTLGRLVPLAVVAGIFALAWYFMFGRLASGVSDTLASMAGFAFFALVTGGVAIGYLFMWFNLSAKGLLSTPKHPWTVALENDRIQIATATRTTEIPLSLVTSLTLVWDDNWDQLKGMEDKCLKISMAGRSRIIIPGSSTNFEAFLKLLEEVRHVDVLFVE